MSCPICEKRKPQRFCPAKGEKICAVCCGTEREVTIDCPSECPYLVAARRYEDAHRKPVPREEVPYPNAEVPPDLVQEQRALVSGLGYHILKLAAETPSLVDADVAAALVALAETYRTLSVGLYYEKPPDASLPQALYRQLSSFLAESKKQDQERAGFTTVKDVEVFHLLVFLLRVGRHRTNGRPRSRAFLDFLRAQFRGTAGREQEAPRIITP
jgi:hypothetical protein